MRDRERRNKKADQRHHRLTLSHGRNRRSNHRRNRKYNHRRNRKLHRSKKYTHKIPHKKNRHKRHRKLIHNKRIINNFNYQKKRNDANKNSRKVEKNLIQGVNSIMRQERNNRIQMYNDWKNYYDKQGRQNLVI